MGSEVGIRTWCGGRDVSAIRRVLFSVDDLGNLGGVQTVVDALATEFHERGMDIGYITLSPVVRPPSVDGPVFVINKSREHTGDHPHAKMYAGPLGSKYLAKRALTRPWRLWRNWRYRRFVERLGSETAIIFTQPGSVDLLFQTGYRRAGSMNGPLIISQLHTSFKGMKAWQLEQMMGRVIANSDAFLALCDADAQEFSKCFGRPVGVMTNPSRMQVVPGVARAFPLELIYAGRLSGEKRVEMIIKAFDIAADQVADWRLVIFGDGPLLNELRHLASRCKNSGRIELAGRSSDIASAFSSASLAVLASSFEGLPMFLIEAARCGVPTVATLASEGVSSIVAECGYPVTEETALGLSRVLVQAMTDEESRLLRSIRGLELGSRFEPARVADEWIELFAETRFGLDAAAWAPLGSES
jgi:glycosyltransferase involved in cell wall biosynthesis